MISNHNAFLILNYRYIEIAQCICPFIRMALFEKKNIFIRSVLIDLIFHNILLCSN